MSDWKIERVKNVCARCQLPFENEQKVISWIEFDTEGDELPRRQDVCGKCVTEQLEGKVFWETRWQVPAEKKKKVDFDRLLRLLEAWLERPGVHESSRESDALMYLVGLLLVRKRFFRMLDLVTHEGKECLRLRRPGPDRPYVFLPAPLLHPDELPALRAKLEELIDGAVDDDDLGDSDPASDSEGSAEGPAPGADSVHQAN